MAFDQPLEADRVDGLNLFSLLVTAPVLGTLTWILGGKSERQAEEKQQDAALLLEGVVEQNNNNSLRRMSKDKRLNVLKKAVPSLIGSEISDVGECAESLSDMNLDASERSASDDTLRRRRRNERQLSWGDESGHDLVSYGNESLRYEPRRDLEPAKPALSRSRSVRSNANRMENDEGETRYLPKGLRRPDSNGPIVPTMPFGGAGAPTSGIESPQWGWYINTTPPTPEMYYSNKPRKHNASSSSADLSNSSAGTSSSGASVTVAPMSPPQSNPVFEGLLNKKKNGPMDWPTVPI